MNEPHRQPPPGLDPKTFTEGCLATAGWLLAATVYVLVAARLVARLGPYASGAKYLALAVVPIAVALGKPPFLRLPLVRQWPWPGIDPDSPDPSTGQGYWLAIAAILVVVGLFSLANANTAAP